MSSSGVADERLGNFGCDRVLSAFLGFKRTFVRRVDDQKYEEFNSKNTLALPTCPDFVNRFLSWLPVPQ